MGSFKNNLITRDWFSTQARANPSHGSLHHHVLTHHTADYNYRAIYHGQIADFYCMVANRTLKPQHWLTPRGRGGAHCKVYHPIIEVRPFSQNSLASSAGRPEHEHVGITRVLLRDLVQVTEYGGLFKREVHGNHSAMTARCSTGITSQARWNYWRSYSLSYQRLKNLFSAVVLRATSIIKGVEARPRPPEADWQVWTNDPHPRCRLGTPATR